MNEFILQQLFPTVGVLTGTFMSFAPFRAVLKASREGHLGDLNPTPWAFMLGNCCGWVAYSFLIQNVFVFATNAPAFILAIWLNIQAIKLQYENYRSQEMQDNIIAALEDHSNKLLNKNDVTEIVENIITEDALTPDIIDPSTTAPIHEGEDAHTAHTEVAICNSMSVGAGDSDSSSEDGIVHDDGVGTVAEAAEMVVDYASFIWDIAAQKTPAPASHEIMIIVISSLWLTLFAIAALGQSVLDYDSRALMIGVSVNCNLVFFYGAPLSKIATVLETKSSELIHKPTMITSLMNGSLWFAYGIAVSDCFIAAPNGFGALLGVFQLFLCVYFPRRKRTDGYYKDGEGKVERADPPQSCVLPEESTPLI